MTFSNVILDPCAKGASEGFCWDVICVTARFPSHAEAYKRELRTRQVSGAIAKSTLLLGVGDPGDADLGIKQARVGSGGATLNALLVVAEHLSALAGESNVDMAALRGKNILILHVGGALQRVPAFSLFPFRAQGGEGSRALSTVDLLLTGVGEIAQECPSGLFVVSSEDSFACVSTGLRQRFVETAKKQAEGNKMGITAMAAAVTSDHARQHGVYALGENGTDVKRILYRASEQQLSQQGRLPMQDKASPEFCNCMVAKVCGVVFFNMSATEEVLQLAFEPVFEPCSFLGIDNGAEPKGFSLYLDLLASLGSDVSLEEFAPGTTIAGQVPVEQAMREQLYRQLHGRVSLQAVVAEPDTAQYAFVRSASDYVRLVKALPHEQQPAMQAFIESESAGSINKSTFIVNSVLRACEVHSGAVVESCELERCFVGAGAVCSGLKTLYGLTIPDRLCLQQVSALSSVSGAGPSSAFLTFTIDDESCRESPDGTFLGISWGEFLERTGIEARDLWAEGEPRTLATARLFPIVANFQDCQRGQLALLWLEFARAHAAKSGARRGMFDLWRRCWLSDWRKTSRLSLVSIVQASDMAAEFDWQETVAVRSSHLRVRDVLVNRRNISLRKVIAEEAERGSWGLLAVLDDIVAHETTEPDVAARALSQVAEVLASHGGAEGGLRSGSARHPRWRAAIAGLETFSEDPSSRRKAVQEMATLRQQWISDGPVALVRMARHYEAAAQVLIRAAVASASRFISIESGLARPIGEIFAVEAPARIDLAGGWTDTPPVAYEHGGAVANLAVRIDGKRPIGARAKRISEPILIFQISDSSEEERTLGPPCVCKDMADLDDYSRPGAPAALLKAAVLCCGAVDLSGPPLAVQLTRLGGGLQITSWSRLPQGSGMGTSSILAGVIMQAVCESLGKKLESSSLIHAVLKVEQMLTTGGGWQDQVGGLLGGAKIARSASRLPLEVRTEMVPIDPDFARALSERLVLVFTGRPRLAKSLLQNVIRRWYSRLPEICDVVGRLTANAELCAEALRRGDLEQVGSCLTAYWEHKKLMAHGCEPAAIAELRSCLSPHLLGSSLAGAGGGGFAVLLMKEPNSADKVKQALQGIDGLESATLHTGEVDFEGMSILESVDDFN